MSSVPNLSLLRVHFISNAYVDLLGSGTAFHRTNLKVTKHDKRKSTYGRVRSISTSMHMSACWISECVSIRASVWACRLAAVVNGLWSVCRGGKAGALWKECGFRQPCPFLSVRTSQGHCFSWHFTWQRRATPERRVKTIITALPLAHCPLAPLHQVCVCECVCARAQFGPLECENVKE